MINSDVKISNLLKINIINYFLISIVINIFPFTSSFAGAQASLPAQQSIRSEHTIRQKTTSQVLGRPIRNPKGISDSITPPPTPPPVPSHTDDIKNSIIDILTKMTCETAGVGDLLRTDFSHTCQSTSALSLIIGNLVAPVTFADLMLILKINDEELFAGNCDRDHRSEWNNNNPTITFALCNNLSLAEKIAEAMANIVVAISISMITGIDPWPEIAASWKISKKDYHDIKPDAHIGDRGTMNLITQWEVLQVNDRICVGTPNIIGSGNYLIPVGCKYIKEPQPEAVYASFMKPNGRLRNSGSDIPPNPQTDPTHFTTCSGIDNGGCYQRVLAATQTSVIITSPIIACIEQMLSQLMISSEVCTFDDINKVNTVKRETSMFFIFQKNISKLVIAFLSLYVAFHGVKMLMGIDGMSPKELYNFIFKMICVTYFSIGINIQSSSGGVEKYDGMLQIVLPFLIQATSEIASWVSSASTNGLCDFSDAKYPAGMGYLALWDSIDCKVSHYLGIDMLRTMVVQAQNLGPHSLVDHFNFSIPPYYYLLIPAIFIGDPTLIGLVLSYPIMVMSITAYLVNSTVVCMIGIVILCFLAPLIVPLYLFNYTKGYFTSWMKLLISFTLQPMIVVTFIITLFAVYDFGFYGGCQYKPNYFSTDDSSVQRRVYTIDTDWDGPRYQGDGREDKIKTCQDSFGFMLNSPMESMYSFNNGSAKDAVGKPTTDTQKFMSHFGFLGTIVASPGILISSPKVVYEKIRNLMVSMLIACFMLYLMHHFSGQIAEFAADLSMGVNLSSVTMNPKSATDAGMSAAGAVGGAISGAMGGGEGGGADGGGDGGGAGGGAGGGGKGRDGVSGLKDDEARGKSGGVGGARESDLPTYEQSTGGGAASPSTPSAPQGPSAPPAPSATSGKSSSGISSKPSAPPAPSATSGKSSSGISSKPSAPPDPSTTSGKATGGDVTGGSRESAPPRYEQLLSKGKGTPSAPQAPSSSSNKMEDKLNVEKGDYAQTTSGGDMGAREDGLPTYAQSVRSGVDAPSAPPPPSESSGKESPEYVRSEPGDYSKESSDHISSSKESDIPAFIESVSRESDSKQDTKISSAPSAPPAPYDDRTIERAKNIDQKLDNQGINSKEIQDLTLEVAHAQNKVLGNEDSKAKIATRANIPESTKLREQKDDADYKTKLQKLLQSAAVQGKESIVINELNALVSNNKYKEKIQGLNGEVLKENSPNTKDQNKDGDKP